MRPGMNPMKAMQKMQAEMAKVQEELAAETVEASVGGGSVKVAMSGDLQVRSVTIDPASVDTDDISMLEDLVGAAVNEALRQAQELQQQKMARVYGGLNLPPGLL
jgi:DNA-binding YbaB/EbfC family protein